MDGGRVVVEDVTLLPRGRAFTCGVKGVGPKRVLEGDRGRRVCRVYGGSGSRHVSPRTPGPSHPTASPTVVGTLDRVPTVDPL